MKILPEPVAFEWDKGNINKNFVKHNVADKEAEEIFENEPKFILKDEKHSLFEKRYMIWGVTDRDRMLSVFFTTRGEKVRIISACDMHKKERGAYEEKTKNYT